MGSVSMDAGNVCVCVKVIGGLRLWELELLVLGPIHTGSCELTAQASEITHGLLNPTVTIN